MRDGTTLVADVHLPRHYVDALPTILERTPYNRKRLDLHLMATFFAARGYAVVLQDCRGRYASEGDFSFYLHPREHLDGFDTVEWIARQAWSNGRVATTGLSYAGANQQALAVERPPHLCTQVILDAGYNYWDRMVRQSGAFTRGIHFPYALQMARSGREAAADPEVRLELERALDEVSVWMQRPLKPGRTPLAVAPSYERWYFDAAARADYDEVWGNPLCSLEQHIEKYPDIPLCLVSSWYGHHARGTLQKFQRLTQQGQAYVKLVIGPWIHGFTYMQTSWAGEAEFGNAAVASLDDFRLRWFDQWMRGVDTGLANEPPIELFVMGGGSGARTLAGRLEHGGRWRSIGAWPPAGTARHRLFLGVGGRLITEQPAEGDSSTRYEFDPSDPVPTVGGSFQDPLEGERAVMYAGGFDQRGRRELPFCRDGLPLDARPDVLAFRTEPLTRELEVVGIVDCVLWVSSSAPDTDFTVKLIDEYPASDDYPAGFALNLADAIVRLRYRNSARKATTTRPHVVYRLAIEIGPIGNLFGTRHVIRLDVSSSNAPLFDVNPNTGLALSPEGGPRRIALNTVHHDHARPSHLALPVVNTGTLSTNGG